MSAPILEGKCIMLKIGKIVKTLEKWCPYEKLNFGKRRLSQIWPKDDIVFKMKISTSIWSAQQHQTLVKNMRLDSNIKSKSSNNTYLNIIKLL